MSQLRLRKKIGLLGGISVLILSAASCARNRPAQRDPRLELLESWARHVILPTYEEFVARAHTLERDTQALCESPNANALSKARNAWWSLRKPWKKNEVIKFGPYREEPLRLGPKLDFWPARLDSVDEVLADTEPLDAETVAAFGATLRGLPPAEYLLYDAEEAPEVAFASQTRRCEYLVALTQDISSLAEAMLDAWVPEGGNYVAELIDPESGEAFDTVLLAVSEIPNRMAFTVEDMRRDKLGRPLGEQSGGSPQPDLVESRPSGRSIRDLLDNLAGVESYYFGAKTPEDALGLADFLPSAPRDYDEEMRDHLSACREALQAIDPLDKAIVEHPALVTAATEELAALQRFIQVDIMGELGFTTNFNDNDGD